MRTHAVSMGLALLLSLSLAQLPLGGHACCCCAEAASQAPCVAACPSSCGTVAEAPCCSTRAVESKQPVHTPWHHSPHGALVPRILPLLFDGTAVSGTKAVSHHGPPLFIVHRALLL